MTTTTTPDLTALDEQIAAAEAAVDAAQNRYRSQPRHGMSLGQGVQRIDVVARAHMLALGLQVDDAVIAAERLKQQKAEARLAELTDAQIVAAEDTAIDAAQRELQEAEAVATQARMAFARANGVRKDCEERVKVYRAEVARAQTAIRSAMAVREKEQTQRNELVGV